jgi:hypothetical protein
MVKWPEILDIKIDMLFFERHDPDFKAELERDLWEHGEFSMFL